MKKFFLIVLLLSITVSAQEIFDIVKPVKLQSDVADTIVVQDLFYAPEYDITIESHPQIKSEFNKETGTLVLTANDFAGFTLLNFTYKNDTYAIPVIVNKQAKVKFSFKPEKEYKTINLFGIFNNWNRNDIQMKDEDGDGTYEVTVSLDPGTYEYKFFCDGEELLDPANPVQVPNGLGSSNSVVKVEETNKAVSYLHLAGSENKDGKLSLKFLYENSLKNELNPNGVYALVNNTPVAKENIKTNGNNVTVTFDENNLKGKKHVRVVASQNGKLTNIQNIILFDGKPAGAAENFAWQDAVIYSIMIDRFNDGDTTLNHPVQFDSLFSKANYNGGDLQGIINKIEEGYFTDLGVNTIWISPVYDNPEKPYQEYPEPHRWYSGYHGYWPKSATNVEEQFGNMELVKTLVKKADEKGIKILLDFVSNHVHMEHPFFKEHREWFGKLDLPDGRKNLRFWDEYRLTTWFEPYLPSFDYLGSEEAIEVMTDNAIWWLKQTGAAGFRHDAVKHVPNKFWRRLTRKIKENFEVKDHKHVYQIGETFGSYDLINSYVNNGQLSAQFNFSLFDTAVRTVVDTNATFTDLDAEQHRSFEVFGYLNIMGNIMDSHDKNRFMSHADGDLDLAQWMATEEGWNNPPMVDHPSSYKKAELYYAWMNSIPGLPVIYYGSEFGMSGASDPDNRRMMRFNDDLNQYEKDMLKEVQGIVHLRKENSALRYGDFYTLKADHNTYAYVRSDLNQRILVVLNKDAHPARVSLQLPDLYDAQVLEDLTTGEKVYPERGMAPIVAPAYSWRMFLIK